MLVFIILIICFIPLNGLFCDDVEPDLFITSQTAYIDVIHNVGVPVYDQYDADLVYTENQIRYRLNEHFQFRFLWNHSYASAYYGSTITNHYVALQGHSSLISLGADWTIRSNTTVRLDVGFGNGKFQLTAVGIRSELSGGFKYEYLMKNTDVDTAFDIGMDNYFYNGISHTDIQLHTLNAEIPIGEIFAVIPQAQLTFFNSPRWDTNVLVFNGALYDFRLKLQLNLDIGVPYLSVGVTIPHGGTDYNAFKADYLVNNQYYLGNATVNLPLKEIQTGMEFKNGFGFDNRFFWGIGNLNFFIKPEGYAGNVLVKGTAIPDIIANRCELKYSKQWQSGLGLSLSFIAVHVFPKDPGIYISKGWLIGSNYEEINYQMPYRIIHFYIPGVELSYRKKNLIIRYSFRQVIPYLSYYPESIPEPSPEPEPEPGTFDRYYGGGVHCLCVELGF